MGFNSVFKGLIKKDRNYLERDGFFLKVFTNAEGRAAIG